MNRTEQLTLITAALLPRQLGLSQKMIEDVVNAAVAVVDEINRREPRGNHPASV